uniref:Uncharacterized protein n=1 Tax=Phenylobacterium glaciei TaxID=2803784 RepID=A0A974S8L9_9CAUL|nr:hypothetical protein JKL49_03150 [Phenylobacterium glaciei]
MFIERRVNTSTGAVELWRCQWENHEGSPAKKHYLSKICDEQPINPDADGGLSEGRDLLGVRAHAWQYRRLLAISPWALPRKVGQRRRIAVRLRPRGKFRHGADRLWCRTHQTHWGTKADLEAYDQAGEMRCANHAQQMNYVVSPLTVNVNQHAEVGIWCSLPAALSTEEIKPRPPKIHVHVREVAGEKKVIDKDFDAIATLYSSSLGLFGNQEITRVNITPPAAFDYVYAVERGQEMDCINCSSCGYPHLDLADFARTPHRKHFCGNCGRDSTWSKGPIVSTPLKPLHDTFAKNLKYETPSRTLDLDQYKGCHYTVWASTPAIVWTAERPQEFGIHVHVHDGTSRIVDDTFGEVKLDGAPLERAKLIEAMIARSVV